MNNIAYQFFPKIRILRNLISAIDEEKLVDAAEWTF